MTLQELRYLSALAKTNHFGRAAALCGVSQPNLSMAIRKLEDQLGYPLFERLPRGVRPTAQGALLLPQAEKVVASIGAIEDMASAQKSPLNTQVILGASHCLAPYLFPKLLPLLGLVARDTLVEFSEANESDLQTKLQAGHIDVVISTQPTSSGDMLSLHLFDEPYVAVLPSAHALVAKPLISAADMQSQSFLNLTTASQLAAEHQQWLGSHPVEKEIRVSSVEMLREMLAMRLGVSFLPALCASSLNSQQVVAKPLQDKWVRPVYLLWRASYPRPQVVEMLRQTIAQCQWPFITQVDAASSGGQLVENQHW